MKSVRDATFNGAKWGMIEKISVQGVRFVLSIVMARLLAPSDYGAVSMILFFIVIGDILVDGGFNNALIRRKAQSQKDYSTVFYFNILVAVCCYVAIYFLAPLVAKFFHLELLKTLLRVQALALVLNSLFAVQMTRLTINLDFKAIAQCNFCASLLSGFFGVVLAYYGFGVWALVFQTLFASVVNIVYVTIKSRWLPSLTFSRQSFREMFGYGSKLLVANLINKIYQNLTAPIIGHFYSAGALGVYDRGTSLAAFPADNVNMVMQKVTFPVMAKLQDDEMRLLEVYKKYIKVLSLVIFFMCILLCAVAKPVILLLLTDKWAGAIIFLQIYVFSVMFNHIDGVNINLMYVKGRSDVVLRLEVVKKVISTAILFASIPFGVVAICVSKIIYTLVSVACDSYYTGKHYKYGLFAQVKDVWRYFAASLLACAPAFILAQSQMNSWVSLSIGCISAIVLYYAIMRKDASMQLIKSVVTDKLSKKGVPAHAED